MPPAPTHERVQPHQDHQPAGEPDEPLTHDNKRETKPLTLRPIGWSARREPVESARLHGCVPSVGACARMTS